MIFDVEEFVSETVFFCCIFFSQTLFCRIFLETGMWKSLFLKRIFFAVYMFFRKHFFAVFDFFGFGNGEVVFFTVFFAVGRGDTDDSRMDF